MVFPYYNSSISGKVYKVISFWVNTRDLDSTQQTQILDSPYGLVYCDRSYIGYFVDKTKQHGLKKIINFHFELPFRVDSMQRTPFIWIEIP